jgi:hypothetical protein
MSGTATDFMVNYYDDGNFYTSRVLPSKVISSVNRQSSMIDWIPSAYYVGEDDTEILKKFMSTIGAIFDDIKLYINQFSNISHISYDDFNRVPNGEIMALIAKHFGFEMVDTLLRQNISQYLRHESDKPPLYQVAYKLWNRVLNNLIYIYKKKGTLESVRALIRTYGLPDTYLQIDDYSFHEEPTWQDRVDYKNVRMLWFDANSWIKFPTSSTSGSWTMMLGDAFTVEAHISTTSLSSNTNIIYSGSITGGYNLLFDGQSIVWNLRSATGSSTVKTPTLYSDVLRNALTTQLVSVFGIRDNSSCAQVWATWIDDTTVSPVYYSISSISAIPNGGSGGLSSVPQISYIGSAGTGNGWFGYIHEVKLMKYAINPADIFEHTENFESVSWANSPGGSLTSTLGEWKLKENQVLTGQYYAVNSWTLNPSNTGQAIGATNGLTSNQYRMIEGVRKETQIITAGDFADDNIGAYVDAGAKPRKSNIVHIGFRPVNAINNDIINVHGDIDIPSIVGDPINFYNDSPAAYKEWGGYPTMTVSAKEVFSRYVVRGVPTKIDFNSYIQALENLSPVIIGIFDSITQLVPIRSVVMNRGVTIEPHLLERSRMPKPIDTFEPVEIPEDTVTKPFVESWSEVATDLMSFSLDNTLSASSQSTRDTSNISPEQLPYVNILATTNYPRIIGGTKINPYERYVNDYADTSVLITLNRNWLNNSSMGGASDTIWQAVITGAVKLIRASTGKTLDANEPTVSFSLPHTSFGSPVSVTENIFEMRVGSTACSTTSFSYEYNIPTKWGQEFTIWPNSNFMDMKIGLQQLVVTNLLNGKTSQIPIVVSTDESGFGGVLTLETQIEV